MGPNPPAQTTDKAPQHPPPPPPSAPLSVMAGIVKRIARIVSLLLIGFASEDDQLVMQTDTQWEQLRHALLRKIENIGIVSGLLLASNANLLISSSGNLRRMTYTFVAVSILTALISLIFDLLCLWALIGMQPLRLKVLTRRSMTFYYLCGTPSIFCGVSAIAFFVAVSTWVWLDEVNYERNHIAKICVLVLSGVIVFNTCICFYLGGSMQGLEWVHKQDDLSQERQQPSTEQIRQQGGAWSPLSDVIVMGEDPIDMEAR